MQSKANLPFQTVSIGKIENKTLEPKLQDKLNQALSTTFAQYGLEISDNARYRLDGEIRDFELIPTTEVNLTATQYQINLSSSFTLTDTESGKKIPIVPSTRFITYFSALGRIEYIMAQKEIAEVSALTDLSQSLVSSIVYNTPKYFTDLLLLPEEMTGLRGLIVKLRDAKDPVSQYLRKEFQPATLRQIDAFNPLDYSSASLRSALTGELNNVIQNKYVYDEQRFAGVALSDKTRRLISENPQGLDRLRLNRMLIEEAYPNEFTRGAFRPDDIINATDLIMKLKEAKDPVSEYLRGKLSADALQMVDEYPRQGYTPQELKEKLADELNGELHDAGLYDEQRFAGVSLSYETRELISENPQGPERMRLNRMLLNEGYAIDLAKPQPIPGAANTSK